MRRTFISALYTTFLMAAPFPLLGASIVELSSSDGDGKPFPRTNVKGPICGILAVRQALLALRIEVPELKAFLDKRYVSDAFHGSTAADLCLALRDHGVEAEAFANLSLSSLQMSRTPLLLHVTDPSAGQGYIHWICFLGVDESGFRVSDGGNALEHMDAGRLMSIWDGSGIVVGGDKWMVLQHRIFWLLLFAAPMLGVGTIAMLVARSLPIPIGARCWRRWASGLVSLSLPIAAIFIFRHATCADGFFTRGGRVGARTILEHRSPTKLPICTYEEFADLVANGAEIVDSRMPSAYRRGHARGAVNLPIHATAAERANVMASIDNARSIVVYCQSEGCAYADIVARHLRADGFEKVVIYPGGWHELRQRAGE